MDTPVRVVLVGDSGVGKSCIIVRYCEDSFQPTHYATIGIDFKLRRLQLKPDSTVTLQLYDTAGQERFRTLSKSFYRKAHAVILVYDNSDYDSFDHLSHWLAEINQICSPSIPRLILGNKSDLPCAISSKDMQEFSRKAEAAVFQVSAKSGENVQAAFNFLVREIMKNPPEPTQGLDLHPEQRETCCG